MDKKYVVCDWTCNGDLDTYVFDTPEAANEKAESLWWHLTRAEKKTRHIYAAVVHEDWVDQDDLAEYGDRAYGMASYMDAFPGVFDSKGFKEED